MNSRTTDAFDHSIDRSDDRAAGFREAQFGDEFILLAEVEDLIRDTTWLTGEELATEQARFSQRRAAEIEARDVVGRAFARQAWVRCRTD